MENFYKMIFDLRYFCKLTLEEIYEMAPFERDTYLHFWEKQKEIERENNKNGGGGGFGGMLSQMANMNG